MIIFISLIVNLAIAGENPYFWKIEKDGKTSYMLGTMHMGVSLSKLPPIIKQTLERSQLVAAELDLSVGNLLWESMVEKLPNLKSKYEKKSILERIDNEDSKNKLVQILKILNDNNIAHPQKLKAWALADAIGAKLNQDAFKQIKDKFSGSLDYELGLKAASDHKREVVGLETLKDRARISQKVITDKVIEAYIAQIDWKEITGSLDERAALLETGLRSLLEAYLGGTLEEGNFCSGNDPVQIALPYRNKNWIKKIDMLHHDSRSFMLAAGACHFFGENGLPKLLEARGYTVTRLSAEGKFD